MNRLFSFWWCRARIRALLIFSEEISMTEKQKLAVSIGVGFLIVAFIFIYRQFSLRGTGMMNESSQTVVPVPSQTSMPAPSNNSMMKTGADQQKAVPATPDGVADDILKNDADTSAIDSEAQGETQAAKENVKTVDDITNSYDNTQL